MDKGRAAKVGGLDSLGHGGMGKFSLPRMLWSPYLDEVMSSGFRRTGLRGEGVHGSGVVERGDISKQGTAPRGSLPPPEDVGGSHSPASQVRKQRVREGRVPRFGLVPGH